MTEKNICYQSLLLLNIPTLLRSPPHFLINLVSHTSISFQRLFLHPPRCSSFSFPCCCPLMYFMDPFMPTESRDGAPLTSFSWRWCTKLLLLSKITCTHQKQGQKMISLTLQWVTKFTFWFHWISSSGEPDLKKHGELLQLLYWEGQGACAQRPATDLCKTLQCRLKVILKAFLAWTVLSCQISNYVLVHSGESS